MSLLYHFKLHQSTFVAFKSSHVVDNSEAREFGRWRRAKAGFFPRTRRTCTDWWPAHPAMEGGGIKDHQKDCVST